MDRSDDTLLLSRFDRPTQFSNPLDPAIAQARSKRSQLGKRKLLDVLDPDQQIVHLSNMEIDVNSQAAFGLLGKAAEAVFPLLRDGLAEKAAIDLKPFAADAKKQIAAVANFSRQEPGVRIDAAITDIRLADIRFDATTLRVIAKVNGAAKVAMSSLGP